MYKIALVLLSPIFLFASSFEIYMDKKTKSFLPQIKKELNSFFEANEAITLKIKTCDKSCKKSLKDNSFYFLQSEKKLKENKNSYLISYNNISTEMEENRLIRSVVLGVYEFIKENKRKNIFIKNSKSFLEVKKIQKNYEYLAFKDLALLISSNNLAYKQNKNSLKLDSLEVNASKNLYRPSFSLYSNYIQIDKDRPTSSNGFTSQGTHELGFKLSQILYSDEILKRVNIQKSLQKANKNAIKLNNDELLYKASLLYLNIIKALKYEKIIQTKRNFISQNLEFSKQRVEIGVSNRSDSFRWESELSQANIELSNAKRDLQALKIEFFNLLNLKPKYLFKEYSLNSDIFKLLNKDAIYYISNLRVQKLFEENMVHNHSSLRQLKKLIEAKKEELALNKNSKYLPTLALEADAKRVINRFGEGKNVNRNFDDDEYQIVLNMNFPLYENGSKNIKIKKNYLELKNLSLQYEELKNLIIENVRKNYVSLKASFEQIEFSKTNEKYSLKNFNLIADKYKNGEENIISLLDAQNAYIYAKLNFNISITEYLANLSSIYFYSGRIDLLFDEEIKKSIEKQILEVSKDKR